MSRIRYQQHGVNVHPINKSDAVASLGEGWLLLPAWVRAALGANDRIKLKSGGKGAAKPAPVVLATAASASIGVVSGELALDEERARLRKAAGAGVILVRQDAETSDIAAMEASAGLLTQRGARTSHAAVVARQLGKVCLVGCSAMQIDMKARCIRLGEQLLDEGDSITLVGNEGRVYAGEVSVVREVPEELLRRLEALRKKD